ncbi:MAG: DnaJ C-terminal domain-containing protein, partial [Planctomycetaceae bacterium]
SGLGTKVDIPTVLDGVITLTIPPGTSSGSKLRLRGKGIRDRQTGKRGDMLATTKIVAPKNPDDRTRELLEELQAISSTDCRAGLWQQS